MITKRCQIQEIQPTALFTFGIKGAEAIVKYSLPVFTIVNAVHLDYFNICKHTTLLLRFLIFYICLQQGILL